MALADNLIAYWSCEEASGSLLDAHGSNDLTDNGSVGTGTGKVGNARDFEASSTQYGSLADNADLSVGDIGWTIAAWVKLESTVNGSIVCKANGSGFEYNLEYNTAAGGFFNFEVCSASGFTNQTNAGEFGSTYPPSTGAWYFLVAQHDPVANLISISVNDTTPTTTAYSFGGYDGTAPFNIGAYPAFSRYFDGLIDEVGFWKRVLSGAEITELYNAGAGRDYAYITGGGGGATGQPTVKRFGGVGFASHGGYQYGTGRMRW